MTDSTTNAATSAGGRPVALVTGAARGLGAAVARELARRGYALALTDVLAGDLQLVAGEVGGRAFPGDLADHAFLHALVPEVVQAMGGVDVLVNNAIWRDLTTMRRITPESWEKTIRIGLTAPAFLARDVAADVERRRPAGGGAVINVSSIMAELAAGVSPAYVAAKGGLESLTAELAALYGPHVRVVAVRPGAIEAPAGEDYGAAQQAMRQFTEQMIPLGRWGTVEEVARAIAWLASPEASYINGVTITIDGGWTRQIHPRPIKRALMPGEF